MMLTTIEELENAILDYEKEIKKEEQKIEENKNNTKFYEKTEIYGMHDTGDSPYQTCKAWIRYYEKEIADCNERIERIKKREENLKKKAEKLNLTVDEYTKREEEKRETKRKKEKYNRYKKEVEELKKELEYKMKWIEDYEKAF